MEQGRRNGGQTLRQGVTDNNGLVLPPTPNFVVARVASTLGQGNLLPHSHNTAESGSPSCRHGREGLPLS